MLRTGTLTNYIWGDNNGTKQMAPNANRKGLISFDNRGFAIAPFKESFV